LPSGGSTRASIDTSGEHQAALGPIRAAAPSTKNQFGVAAGTTTTVTSGGGAVSAGSGGSSAGGTTGSGAGPAPRAGVPAGGAISVPHVAVGSDLASGELVGPRIIETAELSLVTKRGAFGDAFDRATTIARTYHGYVEASSTE